MSQQIAPPSAPRRLIGVVAYVLWLAAAGVILVAVERLQLGWWASMWVHIGVIFVFCMLYSMYHMVRARRGVSSRE